MPLTIFLLWHVGKWLLLRAICHFSSVARGKMVAFTCHLPFFLCGTWENGCFYVPFAIFLSAARWKMVAFTCHLPFFSLRHVGKWLLLRAICHFSSVARLLIVFLTCHLPFFLCGTFVSRFPYVPFALFPPRHVRMLFLPC